MIRKHKQLVLTALTVLLASAAALLICDAAFGQSGGVPQPGMVVMDSIKDRFGAVSFDHQMHTFIAKGCSDCHHEHGSDNSRCSSCHALDSAKFKGAVVSSFLSCRICHNEADKENPGMPGLKVALHNTCFQCHRGMGNIGKGPDGCTEQCHAKAEGGANEQR